MMSWGLFFKATLQVFTLHSALYSAKLAETVFLPGFFVLALCKYLIQKTKLRAQSENLGVKTCRVALKNRPLITGRRPKWQRNEKLIFPSHAFASWLRSLVCWVFGLHLEKPYPLVADMPSSFKA